MSGTNASGHSSADGKFDLLPALGWALSTTFRRASLWLLLGVALFGAIAVLVVGVVLYIVVNSEIPETVDPTLTINDVAPVLPIVLFINVLVVLIAPFVYRLALFQVDDSATGWSYFGKSVPLALTIAVLVVVRIVSGLTMLITSGPDNGQQATTAGEGVAATSGDVIIGLVSAVLSVLIAAITMFMPLCAVSGRYGFSEALLRGATIGLRNIVKIVLFSLCSAVLVPLVVLMTFGLGIIVVGPAYVLAIAHMFRQAEGADPRVD